MDSHGSDTKLDLDRARAAEELKPLEEKLFGILHDLLQPGPILGPAEAAAKVNDLFSSEEADSKSRVDEAAPAFDPESFLWSLWGLVIQVMRLVPPQHPGQKRMISFLNALRKLPERQLDIWGAEQKLWTDLPILRSCIRDHLEYVGETDPNGISEWINQNSFMARVIGNNLLDWDTLIIWMMRDALEDEPPQAQSVQDCYMSVANEWITHAGRTIYGLLSDKDLSEQQQRVTRGGKLYHGKPGLCPERWEFWKSRAVEVSKLVSQDLRPAAEDMVEWMGDIEHLARIEKELRG